VYNDVICCHKYINICFVSKLRVHISGHEKARQYILSTLSSFFRSLFSFSPVKSFVIAAVMRFQTRAPQRFSPSTTHTESRSVYPCDDARSTKFGALSEWESLSFSFALVDCFYAIEANIFSAWILSRARDHGRYS